MDSGAFNSLIERRRMKVVVPKNKGTCTGLPHASDIENIDDEWKN